MNRDFELWKLAIDIEGSGVVDTDKQEYDFDIDLLVRLRNENDRLKRKLIWYEKINKYMKWKLAKEEYKRHVYKIEMGRLRRKLTRIYEVFRDSPIASDNVLFDYLKSL